MLYPTSSYLTLPPRRTHKYVGMVGQIATLIEHMVLGRSPPSSSPLPRKSLNSPQYMAFRTTTPF